MKSFIGFIFLFFFHNVKKIVGLIIILIIVPSLILKFLEYPINFFKTFLINTSSPNENLMILLISQYCINNNIDIQTLEIDIVSFFLALIILFFIYTMKSEGEVEFSFSLSTFLISIILIPFFIDCYFKYNEINMTYMEFFYPYFYKIFIDNFLNYLLIYSSSDESIILIEMYAKAFSYLLQIKKYLFDFFHDNYLDLFILLVFFIIILKRIFKSFSSIH